MKRIVSETLSTVSEGCGVEHFMEEMYRPQYKACCEPCQARHTLRPVAKLLLLICINTATSSTFVVIDLKNEQVVESFLIST